MIHGVLLVIGLTGALWNPKINRVLTDGRCDDGPGAPHNFNLERHNQHMLRIRSSEPEDAGAIAAVILPIQQLEFGIPITLEGQPDLSNIRSFYQHGYGNFWVAEIDGSIVGTIALLDIGNGNAALRKMFVAQPFRGKAHGVAPSLLQELFKWGAEKRVARIYLGTTAKFLAAHRFYEKHGFTEVAKTDLPQSFPVMAVDTRFYRLALQPAAA